MKEYWFLCLLPLGTLGALFGGYKPLDVNDPVIQTRIRSVLSSDHLLGTLPIKKVEQQTLFGVTNYKVYQGIPSKTGARTCVKIVCPVWENCRQPLRCDSSVHPQQGTQDKPEDKMEREISRRVFKSRLLGGEESAEQKDVQGAVNFVVEKFNAMSNSMYRVVPQDITNITKQVVAGMMYRFTLTMVTTQCRNSPANRGKQLDQCRLNDKAEMRECRVAVWYKLSGEYSLESSKCGKVRAHPQRSLLGGDGHDQCHVHLKAFHKFKEDFRKQYDSAREEGKRFQVFCANMKRIQQLQETEQGSAVYGITKFADLSEEEFRRQYLTPRWEVKIPQPWMTSAAPANPDNDSIPDRFDWRDHGAVTPVKNQGSCGSCWAFSTTGNIEGQWAIKSGRLLSLSEQELVDCDKLDDGCEGGLPSNAYQAINQLGGLETEVEYSYKGEDEKCRFNRSEVAVKVRSGLNISSDEDEMKAWLYKNGPISIGINAFAMQFYFGGISHPWKIFCNPKSLDHGVLIVGYNVSSSGEPYWIVKNSWGPDWGEKGYYLVYRGAGVCGLNTMCTSAIVN